MKSLKEITESLLGNNQILYHRVGMRGDRENILKSVISKGLIPSDKSMDDVGKVIWFSNDPKDYTNNSPFVLSIKYNRTNKDKFEMYHDGRNVLAYKPIPFKELTVEKIPVDNKFFNSKQVIDMINTDGPFYSIDKRFNDVKNSQNKGLVMYVNLFNTYVQPYIKIDNFLDKIINKDIKKINFI